jgi:hypothetical protein
MIAGLKIAHGPSISLKKRRQLMEFGTEEDFIYGIRVKRLSFKGGYGRGRWEASLGNNTTAMQRCLTMIVLLLQIGLKRRKTMRLVMRMKR